MARTSKSDGILLSAPRSGAANAAQPQPAFPAESHPRLAIMTPSRLLLGSVASSLVGFSLGAVQGGQMAQLRFRAEHAHKMPDTTAGWYLYHKSKNYHAMQGGIREGFRMGFKTGFWSLVALSLESTVDRYRGSSDMFSTVVATLTVAGAFSLWHRFSLSTAARTAKYGLVFGLAYGGVQDLVGLARGRPIGYVELIRRRFGAGSREDGISDKRSDDNDDANV
ncbi:tim17 tim22 tim23 pmp24 family domain-containing [Trichoderma arundinaceum]|uniref:Tim17 tim22 tim23 pmp24 family domain-containing n=1 Tax=Trichoderma arundinaceum TaxID=490622 RepID=A0A395NQU1_TRIAR|nr:tim17 tim22 tim23 pmp24 family domain-containing [Trichoderma arundinaceum]